MELFDTTPLNWHNLAIALVDSRSEKWPEAFQIDIPCVNLSVGPRYPCLSKEGDKIRASFG